MTRLKAAADDIARIPGRGIYTEPARRERLEWTRQQTGAALGALDITRLRPEQLTANIENFVGAVEIPVGVAGPLLFDGAAAQGIIYAPFATTEGALVASASRGATAITRSGGVRTRVVRQRMLRAPMFAFRTMSDAFSFAGWIADNTEALRAEVMAVSRHALLVTIEPVVLGPTVHVTFAYETGDAAGQNMTTACTWRACQWIVRQLPKGGTPGPEEFLIEGNMSGDKKVNFGSFIAGRGMRVAAECVIEREVLERVLKITPEQLARCNASLLAGGIQAGMVGYNVNVANTVAAIFTATGQDIACVHESSLAHLQIHTVDEGIQASIVLPALIVGTVGGGTQLPAQRALLEMMGCAGPGSSRRLGEIIAGFALALDLSTLAAIASGEFAAAHERLGRNRPVRFLSRDDLTPAFFEPSLRVAYDDASLRVRSVNPLPDCTGSSIISELTGRKVSKLVGLIPLRLHHDGQGGEATTDVVVKAKPLDDEVLLMLGTMASMCGARVTTAWAKHRHLLGFAGCHVRELAIYGQTDERFRRHVPRVFKTLGDDAREAYVVVLERLAGLRLMDSVDDGRRWQRRDIDAALRGIGQVHAIWMGREEELRRQPWLGHVPDARSMAAMTDLWDALAVHASEEFPALLTSSRLERQRQLIASIGEWWPRLEQLPRTLIHNDFNPRNIALRESHGELTLCAYDWELATLHLPQHDLAELLAFVMPADAPEEDVEYFLEVHRRSLEDASGRPIDSEQWRAGYALALRDLCVNRFALYMLAHTFRQYAFLPRAIETLFHLLDVELAHEGDMVPCAT